MLAGFLNKKQLRWFAVGLAMLCCPVASRGQSGECRQEWPDHLVRSVKVKARWLPQFGSSPLRANDILDADALFLKLKDNTPLSQYLRSKLTPATVQLINQHTPPAKQSEVAALVDDLNRLLNDPRLFDQEAFAQVSIRADTQKLFAQDPQRGEGLFRLNRMVFEDAYPNLIAKDPKVYLPLGRGEKFTPEKLSATRFAVIEAINHQKTKFNSEFINLGKLPLVDVNLVTACGREVPAPSCKADGLTDRCVDVEVSPYAISTDPVFMGSILLPLPRSNEFSFLGHVPRPLRLLNPKLGFGYDKELGASPEFEISTDLLTVGQVLETAPADARRTSLMFKARGTKSVGERFYSTQAELSFLARQPSKHIESVGVTANFEADSHPELKAIHLNNALRFGGHLALNPELGLLNRVMLAAAYRRSQHRFSGDATRPESSTSENSYEVNALLDGRVFNGFTRLGLWLEGSTPANTQQSYNRVAGLIGYEKEVPVGEHTIGVEALFGFGKASDRTPDYALFYGGNSLGSFLYQDSNDPIVMAMPSGPLLRSFGKNQGGFIVGVGTPVGANSYEHFNLSASIPIPGLSQPLIPDEVVIANPRKTLRSLINFAVNSGQEALSLNLQDEGLSEEEADKKAAKIFGQIRPGVGFLTHYGKIYSLKPIVMFDQARLSRANSGGAQSRYAIGGGLQFTMVVAKFEAGYMHSVGSFRQDSRGNVVLRLVFQNLF